VATPVPKPVPSWLLLSPRLTFERDDSEVVVYRYFLSPGVEALFRAELAAAEYAGGFILALCGARDDEVDVGDRGGEGRPSVEKS